MAEKAAHHTSSTIINHPSIFEVIAQENLSSTIYPALKKIIYVSSFNVINNFIVVFYLNVCILLYYSILLLKILNN